MAGPAGWDLLVSPAPNQALRWRAGHHLILIVAGVVGFTKRAGPV